MLAVPSQDVQGICKYKSRSPGGYPAIKVGHMVSAWADLYSPTVGFESLSVLEELT